MTATTTEATTPATTTKAPKPPVFDSRGETPAQGSSVAIELGMKVKLVGDQDKDEAGKPKTGHITGIEYQRQRVVVAVDGQERGVVRPASKVFVIKNKSNGKIERVERAVRKARVSKPAAETTAPAPDA